MTVTTLVAVASIIAAPIGIWSVVLLTRSSLRDSARERQALLDRQIEAAVSPFRRELDEMTRDRDYWRNLANERRGGG